MSLRDAKSIPIKIYLVQMIQIRCLYLQNRLNTKVFFLNVNLIMQALREQRNISN